MKLHRHIQKHLKQHHKKYLGGAFAGFALVKTFVLLAGFFGLTNLASTFAGESTLQETYFGEGSEYTTNRTGNNCVPAEMSVEYIAPGTNQIQNHLSGNTIYVLLSGSHIITSDYIYPANCSAIIGSGDVTLYSQGLFTRVIYLYQVTNVIIDNIKIDGVSDGSGGTHGNNTNGIELDGSSNNTIANSQFYNNNQRGIYVSYYSNYTTISNTQAYNNFFGIQLYSYSNNNSIENTQVHNNSIGIFVSESSNYNTINNSQLYDNDQHGLALSTASYNTITDVQTYNNDDYGIFLRWSANNNIINNTQSYNNDDKGIYLYDSCQNNIINNSQIYNNGNHGFLLESSSNNNTINNTQIYNNSYGLFLQSVYTTTLNNSQIYNNAGDGITIHYSPATIVNSDIYNNGGGLSMYPQGPREVKYYGTVKIFGNATDISADEFTAGSDSEFFSGGILEEDTEIMSCDRVNNPMNTDGIFLADEDQNPTCGERGKNSSRSGSQISYLYGTNILTQAQAIQDSGTTNNPAYSWSAISFDANKYIAETNKLLNGSLVLGGGQGYTFETGIVFQLTVAEPADYVLSGDFEQSPITGTLTDTETGNITLTPGYANKSISVTYSTGERTRSFTQNINYPDPNGLPFTYYGSGSTHTTDRTSNACNPEEMTVEYIETGTNQIPEYLSTNTLYILLPGSHITSRAINLATCSALIGSGDVTLYSPNQQNSILYISSKSNVIIDNLHIDGQSNGDGGSHSKNTVGISLSSSSNNTINNSQSYNHYYYGIELYNNSNNNTINNSQVYNNSYGIWLEYYSSNNTINNSQVYNNNNYGIELYNNSNNNTINNSQVHNNNHGVGLIYVCNNNIINNTQVYNNYYGIHIDNYSSNNTINNSQSYNNDYGIYLNYSSNNTINNIQSYNNYYGIYLYYSSNNIINSSKSYNNDYGIYLYYYSNNNKYYGTSQAFDNYQNIYSYYSSLTDGSESAFFSGGTIDTEGTMSCDWITNPVNANGDLLVTTPTCNTKGKQYSRTSTSGVKYLYGANILKQTQALKDTGSGTPVYSWSSLSWDTNKYIAEFNPTINGFLTLAAGQSYTLTTGIQFQLRTIELADYILSGDFGGSPITGTLNGTLTGVMHLTSGYGIKHITVTYSTEDKTRNITKNIGYISSVDNYCEIVTDLPRTQCDALVALYNSTNGSGWYNNNNWLGSGDTTLETACDWNGIYCNDNEGGEYVYEIYLDDNNLSGSIPTHMNGLSDLYELDVSNNNITAIEVGAFSGLDNVYYLYLSNNKIVSLESGAFAGLSILEELELYSNKITNIEAGTFDGLSNLDYLYLSDNLITALQSGVFAGLDNVYQLELYDNNITSIEAGAFSGLSNLEYLYLNDNLIATIESGAFAGLDNLYGLELYNNKITTIESGVFAGLFDLSYIDISDNLITSLEGGAFTELDNLYQLDISNNNITNIANAALTGIGNLQYLYLNGNQITNIEAGAFSGLDILDRLELDNNKIITIEAGAFSGLDNLEYLYLRNNPLTTIEHETFAGLDNLYRLDLYNNKITGSLDVFCPLTSLDYLLVGHNRFAGDIPLCLMNEMSLLRGGDISYNYLNTEIENTDFTNFLDSKLNRGWGWTTQYFVADLALTGTVNTLGNSFVLNLGYQNNGPQAMENTTIYYDMVDGVDIETDYEYTTGEIGAIYGGLQDPCFVALYNSTGAYFDLMEAYAEDDGYDDLADYLSDYYDYYGNNDGAGEYRIDYMIDDYEGDPIDRAYEFDDDFNIDVTDIPVCGVRGKNVYIFDIGGLDISEGNTILITGTFSDNLKDNGFSNDFEILSTWDLRSDGHIRNNRFGYTYSTSNDTIVIDDTTSLFDDSVVDNAEIVTDDIDLTDIGTKKISLRSEDIEAIIPENIAITLAGQSCDVAKLLAPLDKTSEIRTQDPAITAAFQIGSACSGTTINFSQPILIRVYVPEALGDTNVVKISRDGITRENITGTKINDHIIEIAATHFSYFKITTSTTTTDDNPPAGAGGGSAVVKDACPVQRDCSDSYYDRVCGKCSIKDDIKVKKTVHGAATKEPGNIVGSKLSTELKDAYQRAYGYDITTMDTIQKANMEGKLLRKDMAKMISNFAINIMSKNVSTGVRCDFSDMRQLPKETQYYAIAACRLGLMGYESDGKRTKKTFDPEGIVDRAQFGTILSRLLRKDKNNGGDVYYQKHLEALKAELIMTKIDTPLQKEMRGRVMVMMKRIFEKK